MRRVLVARTDDLGDVLLTGPAIRAVAAQAPVVALVSPRGAPAARRLPGVAEVVEMDLPWIAADPPGVDAAWLTGAVARLRATNVDAAMVCTSFHQSALPLALLLRAAGVPRIGAHSEDYPGSLLDVRHRPADDLHEVERSSALAAALGFGPPPGDDGRLALRPDAVVPTDPGVTAPYVVVHPGCSVPARTWSPDGFARATRALTRAGWGVVVTGRPAEAPLVAAVAGRPDHRVRPRTDLDLGALAGVLAGAGAVVAGNTGPAHLAAAVGTPVVSLFPPTVPVHRWRPWGVPHVVLGDQDVGCRGCRARTCPHPTATATGPVATCLAAVTPQDVVAAVARIAPAEVGAR